MRSRRAILGGLCGLAAAPFVLPREGAAVDVSVERAVRITAYPFSNFSPRESERRLFGRLTFVSGMELHCPDPEFGGLSAGVIDADGLGFLAASDHGHWIKGRFVEQDGRLVGVEQAVIAPMRAPDGRMLRGTRYFDVEGMARRGTEVFVSCERTHDIMRFDLAVGFKARAQFIEVPAGFKKLESNLGIESIGFLPRQSAHAGAIIALAERTPRPNAGSDMPGWILGPGGGELRVKRRDNFDLTDVNFLPTGDMLLLERRYVPFLGLSFRIRAVPIGAVRPGAILDGEVLIEADLSEQIDNMEAMLVHQDKQGRAMITLLSDDNFSFLQRTLVLRFGLF